MTQITRLTASDYQTSNWSGGKTTQVFLYPAAASYTDRTFDFRLSTATIEQETSDFTALDGYQRILMTLDQPIRLANQSQGQTLLLAPLTPYAFDGGDAISSQGRCQDFNLIYRSNYQGHMRPILGPDTLSSKDPYQFIFALRPIKLSQADGPSYLLATHELLTVEPSSPFSEVTLRCQPQSPSDMPLAIWVTLH